jgi:fibrillarin-like rRNA methylase
MQLELKKNFVDEFNVLSPERIFDDSIGEKIYQVAYGEELVEVTETTFRSWTGFRMINGEDYHGVVYTLGATGESAPYVGSRSCGCSTCQIHVQHHLKKN